MKEKELKQLLGAALNTTATHAMVEAAERFASDQLIPVMHMGVALLMGAFGILSTELSDQELDEVFAFVKKTTASMRSQKKKG